MRLTVVRRVVAVVALAIAGTVAPATVANAATSRAVIVIGNSTYTVSFNGTVNGLQALQLAVGSGNVETVGFGFGQAVCKINGVGNPATTNECLVGPNGQYWAYYRAGPGASGWQYSSRGASSTTVTDGSVEGWQYGTGGPPPFHSFCSVAGCGPPPAPVTTVPPVGTTGSSPAGGKASTSSSVLPNGGTSPSATGGTTTSTNVPETDAPDEQANGSSSGGRPEIVASDEDGDGSPVGVAIAGGVVLALGGTGIWLRRKRRVPTG